MANYATLKAAIATAIKQNGNNEITGNLLQQQLLAMVNSLGVGYQYAGIATPATNPGTPDYNVWYFASEPGTYVNFDGLTVADGEIAILKYDGSWEKDSTGIASVIDVDAANGTLYGFVPGRFVKIDGTLGFAPGWAATDFFPYISGKDVTWTFDGQQSVDARNMSIAFYDANKNFLDFWSGVEGTNRFISAVTIASSVPTAAYIRASFVPNTGANVKLDDEIVWSEQLVGIKNEINILTLAFDNIAELFNNGYQYIGIATPLTNPGTPQNKVWYFAGTPGTYQNFGGIVVNDGEIAVLSYDGVWEKGLPNIASASELGKISQDMYGKVLGKYVASNGTLADASNWGATDFIPYEQGKDVDWIFNGQQSVDADGKNIAFYDANKNFLDFWGGVTDTHRFISAVTIASSVPTAAYIRASFVPNTGARVKLDDITVWSEDTAGLLNNVNDLRTICGQYISNEQYIRVITDKYNRVLAAVDINGNWTFTGDVEFYNGIPKQIQNAVDEIHSEIDSINQIVPAFYREHINTKITQILSKVNTCSQNGDVFVFLTDTHWESNRQYSPALIKYILQNTCITKVLHGGDIISGSYDSRLDARDIMQKFMFASPLYTMFGNHDQYLQDVGGVYATNSEIYSVFFKHLEKYVNTNGKFYYYFDNVSQKIRYIILDAHWPNNTDNRGESLHYPEQLAWLEARARELDNSWSIVVFQHVIFSEQTISGQSPVPGTVEQSELTQQLVAKLDDICDDASMPTVIAIIGGHTHYDYYEYSAKGYPIIVTTDDGSYGFVQQGGQWVDKDNMPTRADQTVDAQAFDVYTIDKTLRKIYATRIGYGNDREFTY